MDENKIASETISSKQLLRMVKEMRMLSCKAQDRERKEIEQWSVHLKKMSAFVDGEINKVKLRFAAIKAAREQL